MEIFVQLYIINVVIYDIECIKGEDKQYVLRNQDAEAGVGRNENQLGKS